MMTVNTNLHRQEALHACQYCHKKPLIESGGNGGAWYAFAGCECGIIRSIHHKQEVDAIEQVNNLIRGGFKIV